jgi:tetratricopeptide (TPR) repeat protein
MSGRRFAAICTSVIAVLAALVSLSYWIAHSDDGWALEEPARLLPGIGSLHHPISTRSAEAQRFFDQGLTLVYGFDFDAAVRSFRRAAEIDPHSAMPHWGIALARGPNYNSVAPSPLYEHLAYQEVQVAVKLSAEAAAGEQAYINALAKRYTDAARPDLGRLERDYADAMRDVSNSFPDDPDAPVLYAGSLMDLHPWQLWTNDGQPGENTAEIVQVLERVIERWPEHVGANHYYLHAMEASPVPERALYAARRLESLVTSCSHLIHMPAHIYFRSGDYSAAVRTSQQAIAVDDLHQGQNGGEVEGGQYEHQHQSYSGYMQHNVLFLIASAMMDGEKEVAYKAVKHLTSTSRSQLYQAVAILAPLRFGEWEDVIETAPPEESDSEARLFWHYSRGCAFAAMHQSREAELERDEMENTYRYVPPGRAFGAFFNDWASLHTIALEVLDARIDLSRHKARSAIRRWQHAVVLEDQLAFDDLPDWYYPVRESLGAALFQTGAFAEAEQVFRDDLKRTRSNPRSLFGLWKSLQVQSKFAAAAQIRRTFEATWKGSELRIEDL